MKVVHISRVLCLLLPIGIGGMASARDRLQRVEYNNPGLVVDLGVGLMAWPVPMDADGDGDYDLLVTYEDKPSNGTYFFENIRGETAGSRFPVFRDGRRISRGYYDVTPSYVDDRVIVSVRNLVFPDFAHSGLARPQASGKLQANVHPRRLHFNQWRYVDYDGDGNLDLTIGITDSQDYGWDGIGPFKLGFDATGKWTNGPIHGYIYVLMNLGTTAKPEYGPSRKLRAGGKLASDDGDPFFVPVDKGAQGGLFIDGYGTPSQSFEDFDGDGDLDLITGEQLNGFTYYRNVGSRARPEYAAGQRMPFTMDGQHLVVTAFDWDKDGDTDLVVGQEDGRVALIEHTGMVDEASGLPRFKSPRFFRQQAGAVKFGALVTPVGIDWDGDGDDDIIAGNSSGYIGLIENLAGPGKVPSWAAPRYLTADNKVIRIMAGPNGSVQGPSEANWGYTTLTVADWDGDGLHDLVVNSIWGKVLWYRNMGSRAAPELAAAKPIKVQPGGIRKPVWNWWNPEADELVTQWRTTPVAFDWTRDGLTDLVMLDPEGYLALFRRVREKGKLILAPAERIFVDERGAPLKLSRGKNGASGRRKLHLVDWDGDGRIDLLTDDLKTNVRFYRNESQDNQRVVLTDMGQLDSRELARHTTSPTTVDWDANGIPDLLVGAEDGHLYFMMNPRAR